MKDICTISVVTFHPVWGDKASNLRRIEEYIECAYRKGSQIVIFPEMSLTGYDDEADKPFKEKMQYKLAETVPGPSTLEVAELTKKLGMYVIFGMPIRTIRIRISSITGWPFSRRKDWNGPIIKCTCLLRNRTGPPGGTSLSSSILSGAHRMRHLL